MAPAYVDRLRASMGRSGPRSCAALSACRTYRYRLVRVWDPNKPPLAWVTVTGSDADDYRAIGFARAWGYGGIQIGNLYGLRSRTPYPLWQRPDPVGPDNDTYLVALSRCDYLTVLAWGADAPAYRASAVAALFWRGCIQYGGSLAVLGWTENGQPQHPSCVHAHTMPRCLTPAAVGDAQGLHEFDDPAWSRLLGPAAAANG